MSESRLIDADAVVEVVEALFNELDDQLNCHDIKPYKWMAGELLQRLKKLDYAAQPDASDPLRKRVAELEGALEASVGWYHYCLELWDWTRFPDTKDMVIQRKAKAESLLKEGQDA